MVKLRWLLGWMLLAAWAAALAQERVEVITLNYRTAAELIPVIQPLVGPDGAVTGMQNKLIVRAGAAELARVKEVVASLDTRPRQLLITVRQNTTRQALQEDASVYGSVGASAGGSRGRLTLPEQRGRATAQVEVGDNDDRVGAKLAAGQGAEDTVDEQQVRVLEGNAAFIRGGVSVPQRVRTMRRDARGAVVVEESTVYQDATRGFYVTPRLAGDQVVLEISPHRNTLGERGRYEIQQAATTLAGRLGEWIELGGIAQQADFQGSGTAYTSRGSQSDQRSIFVKVEEVR
jgi:hypothetical protein